MMMVRNFKYYSWRRLAHFLVFLIFRDFYSVS